MIVEKRLKSIRQLKSEFPYEYDKSGDLAILIDTRGINDEMIHKFGDGYLYEFEELGSITTKHHFTHRDIDDNWYYHESWFEVDKIDFGIEGLFEL